MERARQATLLGIMAISCVLTVNCYTIPDGERNEAASICLSADQIVRSIPNEENKTCSELISTPGNHFLCYELKNECCDICRKVAALYHNLTDCLYGDRRDWCNNQAPNSCYDVEEDCCFTCQRLHTGISGCQYGDREDNCKDITAPQCYSGGNETCCLSCQKFETGIPDCQYGDRVRLCSRQNCIAYDEDSRNLCCSTCADAATTNVKASPSSSPLILPDTPTTYKIKSGITYMTTLSLGSKTKTASGASTDEKLKVTQPSSNISIVPSTAAASTGHNGSNNSEIVTAANIFTTKRTPLVTSYRTSSAPTTGKTFVAIDTMNSTMSEPAITEVSHSSSSVGTTLPGSSVTTRLNFPEKTPITPHVSSTQISHIVIPSTASTRTPSIYAAQTFMFTKRSNSSLEASTNTSSFPPTVSVSLRSSSVPISSISSAKSTITVRLPISSPIAKKITSPSYTSANISSKSSFTSVPTGRPPSSVRTILTISNTTALKTSLPYTTAEISSTSTFTTVPTVRPPSSVRTKLMLSNTTALKTSPSYTSANISSTSSFTSVPTVRPTSSMRTKLMISNTTALKTSPSYISADISSTSSFTSVPTVRPPSSARTILMISNTTALKTSLPYTTAEISSTSSFTSVPTVRPTSSVRTKLMISNTTALKTVTTKYTMGVASLFPLILESTSVAISQRQPITSPPRPMPGTSNTMFTRPETETVKATEKITSPVSLRLETIKSYTEITENKSSSTNKVLPTSNVLTTLESPRMSSSVPTTLSTNILCLIVFYWIFTEL